MKDDGARLSITCTPCNFTITENLTSKSIIYRDGKFVQFNIDKEIVCNHLKDLQQVISTASKNCFGYKPFGKYPKEDKVTIMERDHFEYRLVVHGKCGDLTESSLNCQFGFDIHECLRAINRVYAIILQANKMLDPTRDIVRRIADVGVLVWVHDGNTIICYENNIKGVTMQNCLINGDFYNYVLVGADVEKNTCTLFDENFNILIEYPLDESIKSYYSELNLNESEVRNE